MKESFFCPGRLIRTADLVRGGPYFMEKSEGGLKSIFIKSKP